MYTVKELADELDITTHAIRYYSDQGLIPHVTRDKNNNRLFDDEAKLWMQNVKYMRSCGMSIHDIKRYVDLSNEGDSTALERFDILIKQKETIKEKIIELQDASDYLDKKMAYYAETIFEKPIETVEQSTPQKNKV